MIPEVKPKASPVTPTLNGLKEAPFEEVEITEEFMKAIPQDHIEAIYLENYWNKCKCDHLPLWLDICVFMGVNSGPGQQQSVAEAVGADPDGAIGPKTLEKVAQCNVLETIEKLLRSCSLSLLKNFDTFGKGWLRETKRPPMSPLLAMKQ